MIALTLSYLGWTLIAATTARHKRNWPIAACRAGGAAALLAALAVCVKDNGLKIGPVYWCMALTTSAALHVLLLWYTQRRTSKQRK